MSSSPRWGRHALPLSLVTVLLAATGCGFSGGGGATPLGGTTITPELLLCRSRLNNAMGFSEIALRTAQNLGTDRIADRNGIERRARLHPDENTIVFARERGSADPASRELFTAVLDGSRTEIRLTLNSSLDDEPCWSPTGDSILFASDRAGDKSLWLCDPDGQDPRPFLIPPAGFADGEPDWSRTTGLVAFVRRDADGVHRLWLAEGDGSGPAPLTDGGGALGDGQGDRDPAFAPDGNSLLFARRLAGDSALLCSVEITTGIVTTIFATTGDIGLPRFTPQMDRIFFGLAEPEQGREPLRLVVLPIAGGTPTLVWPDKRYALEGLEMLAAVPDIPIAAPPVALDVTEAEVQIAEGYSPTLPSLSQLASEDGHEFVLRTNTSSTRQVAGISCVFTLPLDDPLDVLELRVRAIASIGRVGGDSALRMSVHNPTESRFDTAVEIEPESTGLHEMSFTTSSLRHVSSKGKFRVTVIGDIEHGDRSELHIDLVEVVLVARAPPGP
ncbi:MAG: PD40 domain-containing protein [Planctomycetes bacterium]|nr:PD40 domain-containing protein [Planctomycetota bacterium]